LVRRTTSEGDQFLSQILQQNTALPSMTDNVSNLVFHMNRSGERAQIESNNKPLKPNYRGGDDFFVGWFHAKFSFVDIA
jgi:hypothetical protein